MTSGTNVQVEGTFEVDGMTFTGTNWSGLYFASGSEGTLSDVTVQGVQSYGGAAVYATNADLWIDDGTHIDGCSGACSGIQVTGSSSDLWLEDTTVEEATSHGVYISQASANLIGNTIEDNAGKGVYVTSYTSPLFAYASSPYFGGNNTISGNDYGVYATNYAPPIVGTGSAGLGYENVILNNTSYNAWGQDANSNVMAKSVWWGDSDCNTELLNQWVTYSPCRSTAPGASKASFDGSLASAADDPSDPIARAVESRILGDYDRTVELLEPLLRDQAGRAMAERAILELGFVFAASGSARARTLLESEMVTNRTSRAVARQALANALFRRGDAAEGFALSDEQIADYPNTIHERNALLALFYADLQLGRRRQAQEVVDRLGAAFADNEDVAIALWTAEREGFLTDMARKGDPRGEPTARIVEDGLDASAYPNPFNPSTEIRFELRERSDIAVMVYDGVGRVVEHLLDRTLDAGSHSLTWDATNQASGTYFVVIRAGDASRSVPVVLLK